MTAIELIKKLDEEFLKDFIKDVNGIHTRFLSITLLMLRIHNRDTALIQAIAEAVKAEASKNINAVETYGLSRAVSIINSFGEPKGKKEE
jgi:hypothetical protein